MLLLEHNVIVNVSGFRGPGGGLGRGLLGSDVTMLITVHSQDRCQTNAPWCNKLRYETGGGVSVLKFQTLLCL